MNPGKRKNALSAGGYEPLMTPEKWTGDEKRFAIRLDQLMDELFVKIAALNRRVSALENRKEEENG